MSPLARPILLVCALLSLPVVAQSKGAPIDMGSFVIIGDAPMRGFERDPRVPRELALEDKFEPRDLVRRSFRGALLRTASGL